MHVVCRLQRKVVRTSVHHEFNSVLLDFDDGHGIPRVELGCLGAFFWLSFVPLDLVTAWMVCSLLVSLDLCVVACC